MVPSHSPKPQLSAVEKRRNRVTKIANDDDNDMRRCNICEC